MNQSLGLYYQPGLDEQIQKIKKQIETVFPQLAVAILGPLAIFPEAWDTAAKHYDVRYLIARSPVPERNAYSLWVVTSEIGDVWHSFLFGAVDGAKAVVSTARLEDIEDIGKEACHEVGHLLGLGHCPENCLMGTSWTVHSVSRKSGDLCRECREKLAGEFQHDKSIQ
ncbi:MAG: putative Zn-dependent protease [Firmicutes bacterium]|nr:putative Zn-dependent protease [Bacillota bacterium]